MSTRPRNRRQLIVDAAGHVFNERGYHAASLEEIAARVGITAPALYRHFSNKYELFAECAGFMADGLVEALDAQPDDAGIEDLLRAAARVTIAHRSTGGVYRWEARYLQPDDRQVLRGKFEHVVDRVAGAVEPAPLDAHLRAVAALGAIGSITMHRTRVSPRRAEEVLVSAALGAAHARSVAAAPATVPTAPEPRKRREQILAAAIPLFARDGFHEVTLGQVADAVGIATSAIYRHFPAKVDILAAACLQAAALLDQAVAEAGDSIEALAAVYVDYSFEHRDLTSVAEAEIVGLPPAQQRPVVAAQRDHLAVWEQRLVAVRPELDHARARVLVHAGLGAVVEAGRRLRWQDTPENRGAVQSLLLAVLRPPAGSCPGS
ncbi:helix-turn-helix domain-containing protein [Nocardioides caricicola]|uniref:TetR/AcrR family transcriptional regulator n=1 Tax=Nocardioides caricicola TaxID=634770 RepID=A0ABW0NA25_9ACTN